MNRRTPTSGEARYEYLCRFMIGCVACVLDGLDPVSLNPNESHIAFHHDPNFGSVKPDCHHHAYGLCVNHHQGIDADWSLPVRHINQAEFVDRYYRDAKMNWCCWQLISMLDPHYRIYNTDRDVMEHCPHADILEEELAKS